MDKMRSKLEDLKELRDLVRSLGRGGGWGPLRRAPIQYLDMKVTRAPPLGPPACGLCRKQGTTAVPTVSLVPIEAACVRERTRSGAGGEVGPLLGGMCRAGRACCAPCWRLRRPGA